MLTMFGCNKTEKQNPITKILEGSICDENENLFTKNGDTIYLTGNDMEFTAVIKDGKYSIEGIAVGDYQLTLSVDGYCQYQMDIEILDDKEDEIVIHDIILYQEKVMANPDISASETYRITSNQTNQESNSYRLVAVEDSVVSYYIRDGLSEGNLNRREMEKGEYVYLYDYLDITVESGGLSFQDSNGPIDISSFYMIEKLDHSAFYYRKAVAGETITIDNQEYGEDILIGYINLKGYKSKDLVATYKRIDYSINEIIGKNDIVETDLDLPNYFDVAIFTHNKLEFTVTQGEIVVYVWYEDQSKLVFTGGTEMP